MGRPPNSVVPRRIFYSLSPVERIMEVLHSFFWKAFIRSTGLTRWWSELDGYRKLPPDQARARLAQLMLRQLHYFGSRSDALPEWREAARIENPDEVWTIWDSLPIIGRTEVRNLFPPQEMVAKYHLRGIASSTGGSTGEPTPFFHDDRMRSAVRALTSYCWMQFGWQPGMPTVAVWGAERDIGKQRSLRGRLFYKLANLHLIDGFELSDRTVNAFCSFLNQHRRAAVYGYSSMLEFVAKETLARRDLDSRGRVRAAWNGAEMLLESQSDLFERAFGVPICNFYAARETGPMAYQSPATSGLKVLQPIFYVEIVDQAGKPVPAGQTGRLVWTNTVCRGTPFLRYDIGDLGVYGSEGINESGIHTIRELHGRISQLVRLPDGRTISPLYWYHLFKNYPEIARFQVVVSDKGSIEFRLKGAGFSPDREKALRRSFRPILGSMPVVMSWVDEIPLTPQGKLDHVVQETEW